MGKTWLWIGISAAGVFATEDGGQSWERRNRLSNAEACGHHDHPAAPRDGETGHCVHNMHRAPGNTDLLYQQNHHGVWRSADGGRRDLFVVTGPLAVEPHQAEAEHVEALGRAPPFEQRWRSIRATIVALFVSFGSGGI